MKRLLALIIIILLFALTLHNLVSILKLNIEPVESFEKERFLWKGKLNGRARVDSDEARRQDPG